MRVWSVHPRYLDRQGLTACWREGLLAQKVLTGTTRGYRNHPQLRRFRDLSPPAGPAPLPPDDPTSPPPAGPAGEGAAAGCSGPEPSPEGVHPGTAIVTYLHHVVQEAVARGYTFDGSKLHGPIDPDLRMTVTDGQLAHEWVHLRAKLAARSPEVARRWDDVALPEPHPLFVVVPGGVAEWEVLTDAAPPEGTRRPPGAEV